MKKRQIIEGLKSEAERYTPDVTVDPSAALSPYDYAGRGETAVAVRRFSRPALIGVLAAAFALILLLAVLLPLLFAGGNGGHTTLVISINPTAEFTLEDGKVTKTRPLNRDAVLLLNGQDFTGMTAAEACLDFANLASDRKLIGPEGVRIRVTGGSVQKIEEDIHAKLDTLFSVKELDDATLDSLLGGYDEDEIERFGDYLTREYSEKKEEYLARAVELLATYPADVAALDLGDKSAVDAFNKKYLLLGEDFLIESDEDDDFEEIIEELLEEYEEIFSLLKRNREKAFEELFEGFLELLEEGFDD